MERSLRGIEPLRSRRAWARIPLPALVCGCLLPALAAGAAPADPAAVLGAPRWTVLESGADRTVVRLSVPCAQEPADWSAVQPEAVRWQVPLDVDEESPGPDRPLPPRAHLQLAVPTLRAPAMTVLDVTWWRQPSAAWTQRDLVLAGGPRVYRSVPLAGAEVALAVGGGILAAVTLQIDHPASGPQVAHLQADAAAGAASEAERATQRAPEGLLNPELFAALSRGAAQAALQVRPAAKAAGDPATLFGATSHWVRLRIQETGLYRLTGLQLNLMGVGAGDVDPDKLRLWRGGGMALAADPQVPPSEQPERVGLTEVAIDVLDGGDGEWNLDDELRFYGVATSAWRDRFEAGAPYLDHYDHPFAQDAIYWLTWEDEATPSPLPGTALRVPHPAFAPVGGQGLAQGMVRLHQERQAVDEGGLVADNWVWDNFVYSSRDDEFELWEPVAGAPALFVVDVRGNYGGTSGYPFAGRAWLNSDLAHAAAAAFTVADQADSLRVRIVGQSVQVQGGTNVLNLVNDSTTYGVGGFTVGKQALALDSFDVLYVARLELATGRGALEFILPQGQAWVPAFPADLQLTVPGGETVVVWDVTDPAAPFEAPGRYETGDPQGLRVSYAPAAGGDRHLLAVREADLRAVPSGALAAPIDLLAAGVDYDHLTLYAADFAQAARDLASFRDGMIPGIASPAAAAVLIDDIYDNFSGGQKDPRAIRNYLMTVYERSGHRLSHVCLIGKACRDYRNYRDRDPLLGFYDFLPTDIRTVFPDYPVPLTRDAPYASDDGLVSFDPAPAGGLDLPDLACGRLPAATAAEAAVLVGRAIAYSAAPPDGPWRNTVLFAADDANRPQHGAYPLLSETSHTEQADLLIDETLPLAVDARKIYGVAYSFPSPSSNVKPQMRADILAALSEGTTIFHYIGHGAEDNLADEQIFQSRDIPALLNGEKRLVFLAFSCDVGVYDSPTRLSMAEQFLNAGEGGAVGCICASQVSYVTNNNVFSAAFYRELYPQRHVQPGTTVGAALAAAKSLMSSDTDVSNSQRFNLMGDPAVALPHPVDDLQFAADSVDTLVAGLRQVVRIDGEPGAAYDLRVEESAYDQPYTVYSVSVDPQTGQYVYLPRAWSYRCNGAAAFAGTGLQQEADLAVPFMNPVQFRYGEAGRIRLTLDDGGSARAAAATVPAVRGTGAVGDDLLGPDIALGFAGGRYRVRPGDQLTAAVVDTSGVAILGTSPGNSLLLEFDDTGFMTDVTASFQYDANSYTQGRLAFPLPMDLALGAHRAALHASDALGNVGSDTLSFQVIPEGVKGMEAVTVFPNPTAGPCRLLFDLSDPMAVQWDIYTLAGRRIATIRDEFTAAGPGILRWDGRDQRGDEIANGTYLYVLRGLGAAEQGADLTKTGKLVIMR